MLITNKYLKTSTENDRIKRNSSFGFRKCRRKNMTLFWRGFSCALLVNKME